MASAAAGSCLLVQTAAHAPIEGVWDTPGKTKFRASLWRESKCRQVRARRRVESPCCVAGRYIAIGSTEGLCGGAVSSDTGPTRHDIEGFSGLSRVACG